MNSLRKIRDLAYTFQKLPEARDREGRPLRRGRSVHQMQRLVMLVLSFGVLVLMLNIYQLNMMRGERSGGGWHAPVVEGVGDYSTRQPIVWVKGKRLESGYLRHVFNVFERIGYQRGVDGLDWDVLWAHDYPFGELKEKMLRLKPHQKVNHFPGSGYVTNKLTLVTSAYRFPFMPQAFQMPKDKDKFEIYSKMYPDKMWIQKSNNHRGIKIRKSEELELSKQGTFIQVYVDKPYLIDGRRFDIGIYTTLTSIDPLRAYIFEGDWLVRFCPEVYHPFDPKVLHKYVITDDYMPMWELPSLKRLYEELDFTRKETLFTYLRQNGKDPELLAERIHSAIREVYLTKEAALIQAASSFQSTRNFFEMVRFDFIVDEDLNVYLMEVNMSPNMSSGHFSGNKLLYEQVLFSMLGLIGVARAVGNDLTRGQTDENDMQVHNKDLRVYIDKCAADVCKDTCRSLECKFCSDCLKVDQQNELKSAYLEHVGRKQWRRMFPAAFKSQEDAEAWKHEGDREFGGLRPKNQWMTLWFHGKCLRDATWCS